MANKSECVNNLGISLFNKDFGSKKFQDDYNKECSMYDEKELNCVRINSQLQSLIQYSGANSLSPFTSEKKDYTESIADIRKQFDNNNCTQLLEKHRQSELGIVFEKFTSLDKTRIEAESIYERNQRIFFGGLILVSGIVILTMFSKEK